MIVEVKFSKYFRGHWILIVIHPASTKGPGIFYVDPLKAGDPNDRHDLKFVVNK